MILLQDRAGYAQRILATLRQFQRPSHVALRHASAAQVPLLRSQLQRPIRFRAMSGHVVLSAQMQHIGQVAAFKWLQRQPKLTHIIQRHMVRIRNACRSGLGRKSPIKILAQRLDPASSAPLPFKNEGHFQQEQDPPNTVSYNTSSGELSPPLEVSTRAITSRSDAPAQRPDNG